MSPQTLKDIKKLCDLIVNSPPETTIKGEIESLALWIGHDQDVMNADNESSIDTTAK